MRKIISTMILALCALCGAQTAAAKIVGTGTAGVSNVRIERDGKYLSVDMTIDLRGLAVGRNNAVLLTPRLTNGEDSIELASVGVYGRKRYYHYKRNGGVMISGTDETSYLASKAPSPLKYHQVVAYEDWMNGAVLTLHDEIYGCCNSILAETVLTAGGYSLYKPKLVYVQPQAEASKTRSIEASAFIDFPVNKTVIDPDYHTNKAELEKITSTIDSVKNDADYTISTIMLKGYASPEGSYAHNDELAQGRTEALSDYVRQQYSFAEGIVATDHEAEDWTGLRKYVEKSSLEHRTEILAIIDDNTLDEDSREAKIHSTYPDEYAILLNECYPKLRHTDYKVGYTVRTYSDVEEIKKVMRTTPQKLSLQELYLLSKEYEPGSDEFIEVFETAVRMYPDDETANLNAANAALSSGDLDKASRFLEKVGESGEAEYARGILEYMSEDYRRAYNHLNKAADMGVKEAEEVIGELKNKK